MSWLKSTRKALGFAAATLLFSGLSAGAFDLTIQSNGGEEITDAIRESSLLAEAENNGVRNPQEIIAAARTDYRQVLGTLYKKGYYSGVVSIMIDGREAASLPPFFRTRSVSDVRIAVKTGEPFVFGRIGIAPLAPETELPESFARGEPALAPVVGEAVDSAILAWREVGHAKAEPTSQSIVADHARNRLDASVTLDPGPRVRFGDLNINGAKSVRERRIREIAGLPRGEVYSPDELDAVAQRLRDTGAFRSVSLSEGETVAPDGRMDITARLVEEKPRRFGVGAEIESSEGVSVSTYWMHRNLLGGAENLRFDAEIGGIGSQDSGTDYRLGAVFSRPGTFAAANTLILNAEIAREDEPEYKSDSVTVGAKIRRRFSERIEYSVGLQLRYSDVEDDLGSREFTHLAFPIEGLYDARDSLLDPTDGYYLRAEIKPYLGLADSASGARFFADGRAYFSFGDAVPVTLAGRAQLGSVVGSGLRDTPPDLLFYSGGGGTVRGQPYQSLAVDLGGGNTIGGRSFLGLSGEARIRAFERISFVVFADAGFIGEGSTPGGDGNWHSGAGLGLRYNTGVGPIRLDVATPVSGDTGDGVQIYVGIGQAF